MSRRRLSAPDMPLAAVDLPPTVQQLLTLMPACAVIRLIHQLHGERLYFCQRQKSEADYVAYAKLEPVIGDEYARTLIREWRGDALEIPNCARAVGRATARWLREQYDAGVPLGQLCRQTGYSRRWVFYLLKRGDENDLAARAAQAAQKELF